MLSGRALGRHCQQKLCAVSLSTKPSVWVSIKRILITASLYLVFRIVLTEGTSGVLGANEQYKTETGGATGR